MKEERKILRSMFILLALAALFPPWQVPGGKFETFGFAFLPPDFIPALEICWPLLVGEISFILFWGIASYFVVKNRTDDELW